MDCEGLKFSWVNCVHCLSGNGGKSLVSLLGRMCIYSCLKNAHEFSFQSELGIRANGFPLVLKVLAFWIVIIDK